MNLALGRKTTTLFLACSLISAAAFAHGDWDKLVGNDYVTVFRDNSTTAIEGPYIRVWTLWSYADPQDDNRGFTYQSSKALLYADCAERSIAFRTALQYEARDGSGTALSDDEKRKSELAFEVPIPDSIGARWVTTLCPLRLTP